MKFRKKQFFAMRFHDIEKDDRGVGDAALRAGHR